MDKFGMGIQIKSRQEKITTGISGLDRLIGGGFPKGSIVLISGTPGTGKTIVCFQYLWEGIKNNEKCLFLTSDERIENLQNQAKELGFNFQKAIEEGLLKFMFLDLETKNIHKEMEERIRSEGYSRIVLDSLTPLSEVPVWVVNKGNEIIPMEGAASTTSFPIGSVQATRVHIRRIMNILEGDHCTCLVTSEIPEGTRNLSRDTISEFLVDGIILLDLDTTMDRRKLTIRKMRGTKHTLKPQDVEIKENGIELV